MDSEEEWEESMKEYKQLQLQEPRVVLPKLKKRFILKATGESYRFWKNHYRYMRLFQIRDKEINSSSSKRYLGSKFQMTEQNLSQNINTEKASESNPHKKQKYDNKPTVSHRPAAFQDARYEEA